MNGELLWQSKAPSWLDFDGWAMFKPVWQNKVYLHIASSICKCLSISPGRVFWADS